MNNAAFVLSLVFKTRLCWTFTKCWFTSYYRDSISFQILLFFRESWLHLLLMIQMRSRYAVNLTILKMQIL